MGELIGKDRGVFFEYKQSPEEKATVEYRRRIRVLESKVENLAKKQQELEELIKQLKGE